MFDIKVEKAGVQTACARMARRERPELEKVKMAVFALFGWRDHGVVSFSFFQTSCAIVNESSCKQSR